MQQKLQKLKTSFLFFLELQILISLVILPMLIAWGLPISAMSILGNLIFGQFLTVFIFISALVLSTDLLGIPNYYIMQALEWVTSAWYYVLSYGQACWLVGFSSWMFPISLLLAIIGCSLYHKNKVAQNYRIIIITLLFSLNFILHQAFQPRYQQTIITQGLQKMYLVKVHDQIYAFDCGALTARPSSQSWIEYTFMPNLIKTMGTTSIHALILCKSNSRTEQALEQFLDHVPTTCIIKTYPKN